MIGAEKPSELCALDLHPAGAALSNATNISRGIVLGDATYGSTRVVGTFDLATGLFVPITGLQVLGYATPEIMNFEVDADGRVTLVGFATHVALNRREAFKWTGVATIPGDLNGSGTIDALDLAILLGAWGSPAGPADLDRDGVVAGGDLAVMFSHWG